ncbi:MAG: hypothetical protein K9W44_08490 [Candidatus Lokiarchaeota archaeon]|nr:hypothetical protein [Candidatus Harpocratesius repetitus]
MLTLQTKRIVSIMFLGVLTGIIVISAISVPVANDKLLFNSQSNMNGMDDLSPTLQAPGGVTVDHLDNVTFIEGDMNMTVEFTPHLDGSITEDYYEIWDITSSPFLLDSDIYTNNTAVSYNLAGYSAGNYTIEARFMTYENVNGTAITDVIILPDNHVDVVGFEYLSFQEGNYMELSFTPYLYGELTPDYFEIFDVTDNNDTLLYVDYVYYNASTVYYALSDYNEGHYVFQGRFYTIEGEMGYWNITVDIYPYDDRWVYVDQPWDLIFYQNEIYLLYWTPFLYGNLTPYWYEIVEISEFDVPLYSNNTYFNGTTVYYELNSSLYGPGNYVIEARFYTYENITGYCSISVNITTEPFIEVIQPEYLAFNDTDTKILSWTPIIHGSLTPTNYSIVDVYNGSILVEDMPYSDGIEITYILDEYGPGYYEIGAYFYTIEGKVGYCSIYIDIFDTTNYIEIIQPEKLTFYENETIILSWLPILHGDIFELDYIITNALNESEVLYYGESYQNNTPVDFILEGYGPGDYFIQCEFYADNGGIFAGEGAGVPFAPGFEGNGSIISNSCIIEVIILPSNSDIYIIQPEFLTFTYGEHIELTWIPVLTGPLTPDYYEIIDMWGNNTILEQNSIYYNNTAVTYIMDSWLPGNYSIGARFYTLEGIEGFCSILVEILPNETQELYVEVLQPEYISFIEGSTYELKWTPILHGILTPTTFEIIDVWNNTILFTGDSYSNNTDVYFILDNSTYGPGSYSIGAHFYTAEGYEGFCSILVEILPNETQELYVEVLQPEYISFIEGSTYELKWTPILHGILTPTTFEIIDVWNNTILFTGDSYWNNTDVYFILDNSTYGPGNYSIGAHFYTAEGYEGFCSILVEILPNETQELYVEVLQPEYISFIEGSTYELKWTPILHGILTPTTFEIIDVWNNTILFTGDSYWNNTDVYFILDNSTYGPGSYSIGAHFYTAEGYEGFCSIQVEIFPMIINDWIEINQPDSLTFYDNETIILEWIPILHGNLVPDDYFIIDVNAGYVDLFHGSSYVNNTPVMFNMSGWLPGTYMIGAEFWAFTDGGEGELISAFCSIEVTILDSGSSGGSDILIDQPDVVTIYEGDNVELNWTITLIYLTPDYYDIYNEDTGTALIQHETYNNGSTIRYNVSSYSAGTYHIGIRVYTVEGMTAECQIELHVLSLSDIILQYTDTFTVNYSQPLEVWFIATIPSGFTPSSWELLQDGVVLVNGTYESGVETTINVSDFLLHVGTYQFDLIVYGVDNAGQEIQANVTITVNVVMEGDGGESPFGDLLNNIPGYPSYIVVGMAIVSIAVIIKKIRKR